MPDTNSPRVTMADDDLRPILSRSKKKGIFQGRKWSCPEDEMLAAYVDGALGGIRKTRVEFHLSGCLHCRLLVAETVKAQREMDLPLPPGELKQKAIRLAEPRTAVKRWIWVPAGALVALAVLLLATAVMRKPESLIVQTPPSPSVTLMAKSKPALAPGTPVREIERKRTSTELLPRIVLPQPNSVVAGEQLKFGWKSIPHSRYYEVRVVTTEGDLVWEVQTEKSDIQPPSDLHMQAGSYFVWITAYLADGQIAKSLPVKFIVKR